VTSKACDSPVIWRGAMFSTSVLECHKSLDQAMKQSVLTENLPDRASKRPSWPSRLGPGLFASDKENRPETEALEMKVTKSAWWLQQREADALKQQQLQQRLRAGAEEQLQHVRSARRSEGALEPSDSGLRRRCQELERERDSLELRAKAARRLEAELEAEKAPSTTKWEFPKIRGTFFWGPKRKGSYDLGPLLSETPKSAETPQPRGSRQKPASRPGPGS